MAALIAIKGKRPLDRTWRSGASAAALVFLSRAAWAWIVAPDLYAARERRRTASSFADPSELAQDEDHARDQGGLGVEQIVDVVGELI
jgi:hypothetical protein